MKDPLIQVTVPFEQGQMRLRPSHADGSVRKYIWDSKRHCNAEYELHVILHGECTLDVEDNQYQLHGGQVVLIAPGKYHKPSSVPGEFERFSLSFTLAEGSLLSAMKQAVPQCACFAPSSEFMQYCKRFVGESERKTPFQKHAQEALLTLLAVTLIRDLQLANYQAAQWKEEETPGRIDLIDNYFERHFHEKNGCAVLAEQLHLSKRQLDRILNAHYGMGFQEKLIQTRMDHAALLLRTSDKTVQDIIGAVGYNSVTAFYKAFRDTFRMTPQQYRQHCEKMTSYKK
jgi:AraC-like DNA-binding protein